MRYKFRQICLMFSQVLFHTNYSNTNSKRQLKKSHMRGLLILNGKYKLTMKASKQTFK